MGIKSFLAIILIAVITLFLTISPNKSFAWICGDSQKPQDLFNKNDYIFTGKVIELSYEKVGGMNPKSRVTFEVKSTLKGNNSEQQTVVVTAGSKFTEGIEYLVYAYKTTKDNYLYKYKAGELATDPLCGGTKELALADYDLEKIAEAKSLNKIYDFIIIASIIIAVLISLLIIIKRRRNVKLE